jgi:hypothetical protein
VRMQVDRRSSRTVGRWLMVHPFLRLLRRDSDIHGYVSPIHDLKKGSEHEPGSLSGLSRALSIHHVPKLSRRNASRTNSTRFSTPLPSDPGSTRLPLAPPLLSPSTHPPSLSLLCLLPLPTHPSPHSPSSPDCSHSTPTPFHPPSLNRSPHAPSRRTAGQRAVSDLPIRCTAGCAAPSGTCAA